MPETNKKLLYDLVLKAIQHLEEYPWESKNNSRTGDLVYKGKPYPTKPILWNVEEQIEKGKLDIAIPYLSGGEETFKYLEKLGFEIKRKSDIKILIENYKKLIRQTHLKDEIYKWKLLKEFKGRPNLEAPDLLAEFKSINYSNLVYAMGKAVLYHLVLDKPEEMRALFKILFDGSKDLNERIKLFNTQTLLIYRSIGETLQHHQDERTIASYLTFHDPTKYTFYKFSFYKKLCVLLSEKQANKNEKYNHYLSLLKRIIIENIENDEELIELVKQYVPDYYDGTNHLLLAQDILYQMLDKRGNLKEINVKEDFIEFLVENRSGGNYFANQFASKLDRLVEELEDYELHFKNNFNAELFIIDTKNAITNIESIKNNIYRRDTDFHKYNLKHYSGRPKAILGNNNYLRFLQEKFGTDDSCSYWIFQGNPKIYDTVASLNNNSVATWMVSAHKDRIKKGDKFILWQTGVRAGCYALGTVTSDVQMIKEENATMSYYLTPTPQVENTRVKVVIDQSFANSPILWDNIKHQEIFNDFKAGNQGTNFSATREEYNYFNHFNPTSPSQSNNNMSQNNLNQILYGPPGTGKTFKLQQIIKDWNLAENAGTAKDYSTFVKEYTWWKIIALALYDLGNVKVPDLAKHPLIIAKLGSSNVKSLKTRLWSSLQHHCVDDCENVKLVKRIGERVFYKETNSEWRLDNSEAFQSEYDTLIEAYSDFKTSDQAKSKDYTFTTCHQSLSYEDFIEGIKPDLSKKDEDDINGLEIVYEIRRGIFYNACEKAAQKAGFINLQDCLDSTPEIRKELFDKAMAENNIHVIFLDEINRCNVSSVFGELITLIEEDKRLGKENEMADITLPYSQDEFGVPANLFIIGTMNTADRSVEALDTALRRRFCFEELMPDATVIEKKGFKDYPRKEIMVKINNRIELLLDRNHTLGHAYFLKSAFENSFKNEIIPLLQEYFYNDFGKIGLVLGKGFVREKSITSGRDKSIFADFETKNDVDINKGYELVPFNEVDFDIAIQTLLT